MEDARREAVAALDDPGADRHARGVGQRELGAAVRVGGDWVRLRESRTQQPAKFARSRSISPSATPLPPSSVTAPAREIRPPARCRLAATGRRLGRVSGSAWELEARKRNQEMQTTMRVIAGASERPPTRRARLGGPAAHLRQAARDALQRARAAHWRTRGCSTALPGPARSGIEALSRGAAHVTFVESRCAGGPADRAQPRALRRRGPLCYYPREVCGRGATGAPQGRSTWCFSIRRIRADGMAEVARRGGAARRARRTRGARARAARCRAGARPPPSRKRATSSRATARSRCTGQPRPASGRDRQRGATRAHSRSGRKGPTKPCPARSWPSTRGRSTR